MILVGLVEMKKIQEEKSVVVPKERMTCRSSRKSGEEGTEYNMRNTPVKTFRKPTFLRTQEAAATVK